MKIITQELVRKHLDVSHASELIADGFRSLGAKEIANGSRTVFAPRAGDSVVGFMPASDSDYFSAKVACVSYGNPAFGLDSHQGAVLLFEKPSGVLKAVIDATELTAIRTTAVTHLALGRLTADSRSLGKVAILGAGVQAFHHIKMLSASYELRDFVIVTKSSERFVSLVRAFADDLKFEHRAYGCRLQDCDVVVLATHGREVILTLNQVKPSVLIFALGACHTAAQEVGQDLLDACEFIADDFEACARSSGEGQYIAGKRSAKCLELVDIVGGLYVHQMNQPVVIKMVGLGFEDLVCARYLYETVASDASVLALERIGGLRAY